MAHEERRDERYSIRLPTRLLVAIKREAKKQRRKPSDVIVLALEDAFGKAIAKGKR